MDWWLWAALALVLLAIEILASGSFFIFFFAVAALLLAPVAYFGVTHELSHQLAIFAVVSLGALILFRKKLTELLYGGASRSTSNEIINEIGTATENIGPGDRGKIELRGATWSAKNTSTQLLRKGFSCKVVELDGLIAHVHPLEKGE
jgi:membrane protein implicated in regulation of membrane protease activity